METIFPSIVDYGYEWVIQYGYLGIFILLFLGVFGLPIPDEIILAYAGYLVFKGDLEFSPTILSAFVGAMGGISLSYGLGHTAGMYLVERYGPRINLTITKMERTHDWFERMGRWALMFGYFFPGIRHLTALIAGSSGLQYPIFAVYAYIGALFWTGAYILIGYFLGERWSHVSEQMHDQLMIAAGIMTILATVYYFYRQWKQKRI